MLYPVFLDVRGKRCVVIGGGEVAARKVEALLAAGAEVSVAAPDLVEELETLAHQKRIHWMKKNYDAGAVSGAFLVVAATDDEAVNRRANEDCRAAGILINVVDVPDLCDFHVPATMRRGDLCLAIGTGGKSPAMARRIRLLLEQHIGPEYGALLDLLGEYREQIKQHIPSQKQRQAVWERILDSEALEELAVGRPRQARDIIERLIREGGGAA